MGRTHHWRGRHSHAGGTWGGRADAAATTWWLNVSLGAVITSGTKKPTMKRKKDTRILSIQTNCEGTATPRTVVVASPRTTTLFIPAGSHDKVQAKKSNAKESPKK